MKFFEIFKAGIYPQGVFSPDDVEALAKNYSPEFCEAPITLDHDQKGPAYGWVSELKAENGKLKASFRSISDELKDYVQAGKYRKISVEIYKNLEGKKPYLKAVSFLGASIPQVKGMEPVEFKDAESEKYVFDVDISETEISTGKEIIKNSEPTALLEIIKLQNQVSEIESRIAYMANQPDKDDKLITFLQEKVQQISAQMKELEEIGAEKQKAEKELAELKQQVRINDFEQFLNEQITAGTLIPAQKDTSLNLLVALDDVKQFDETDYVEEFKEFIKTLPKQVELEEIATKQARLEEEQEFLDFVDASEDSLNIYKEARKLAKEENISFKDALIRLYE